MPGLLTSRMSMCGQEGWGEEKVLHELGNE